MRSLFLTLGLMALKSLPASAELVTSIPAVGPHFPILVVEKNINPQNIMTVYTKLDANCTLETTAENQPVLGFYWLIDKVQFKPVHPLIRTEVEKRLELVANTHVQQSPTFSVLINDLKELDHDLKEARITVQSRRAHGQCAVEGLLTLGPSDNNRTIVLQSIYSEARGLIMPKVVTVTLKGTDLVSGEPVTRTFHGQ